SHVSDFDGIASAAIASLRYPTAKISFHSYGCIAFRMMFEKIESNIKKAANKGIVIISDLGINYDVEDLCYDALGRFNEMKWKIVWVDHHQWSKGIMKRIGQLATLVHAGPMRKCAAELMHEYLLPGNHIAKQLSEMAHKTDFNIEYQSVSQYTEMI